MKEYRIVEPELKLISVFRLDANGRYGRPEMYSDEDTVKVSILPDLEINLKRIFEETV